MLKDLSSLINIGHIKFQIHIIQLFCTLICFEEHSNAPINHKYRYIKATKVNFCFYDNCADIMKIHALYDRNSIFGGRYACIYNYRSTTASEI